MECPRCSSALHVQRHRGIEVDACPNCRGLWLDHHELDQLEDTVLKDDSVKGTMLYAQRDSDIACPRCHKRMVTFNYRAHNLPIDFCPDQHGFWLDRGEDKRVLELMRQRIRDLGRSRVAQVEWRRTVRAGGRRGFLDRLRDLFR